jgi:hypothetical protein
MNMDQAKQWVEQLRAAIAAGKITKMGADEEVFAEMENGDHDQAVEAFFYEFTRSEV